MQWPQGVAVSFAGLVLLVICFSKGNHWAFPQGLLLLQQDTNGMSTAKVLGILSGLPIVLGFPESGVQCCRLTRREPTLRE